MSEVAANCINYEKAISNAINNSEKQVKEKHVRLVIIGTFAAKGAELFWRNACGFPYKNNKMVAWKLCYVLHKVLREGHPLCCVHSQNHKLDLNKIGRAWHDTNDDFGKIIPIYTKLLLIKLLFHKHNPEFPSHLEATLADLQLIVKNDMTNYFQLSIDLFAYLDDLLQFQKAVLESMLLISEIKFWDCKLPPLVLCFQESLQIYNHCVRILFILHSYLPTKSLEGLRIKFEEQFKQLKQIYSQVSNIRWTNNVPIIFHKDEQSLPKNAPNFLIEANLALNITSEGLGSEQNNFGNRVDKTPIIMPQNMDTKKITIPKSNAFSNDNLIDLSDSPILVQSNQRSIPASHFQTQNVMVPLKKNESIHKNWFDPFDTIRQTTERTPISPAVHERYIEDMSSQETRTKGNAQFSAVSYQNQSNLKSMEENSLNPYVTSFNDPCDNRHLNIPPLISPFKESESMQQKWFDPFDTSFLECGQQTTENTPISPIVHQRYIEDIITQQSMQKSHARFSSVPCQNQPKLRSPEENSLNPFFTSFNDSCDNRQLNVPPIISPTSANVLRPRLETTGKDFSNHFETSFAQGVNNHLPSAPPLFATTDHQTHAEAIIERDNIIQYLQHKLEMLKQHNRDVENYDNFHEFQARITPLEKSLTDKENELMQEKQAKILSNQVPSSLQFHPERNVLDPKFGAENSKTFLDIIKERQAEHENLKTRDFYEQTGNTDSDDDEWDEEDEIDEVQNRFKGMELDHKIRDIQKELDDHMQNKDLEVWNNNTELFNIKTEILKMNLENLTKQKQTDVVQPEEKVKKKNLVNRKFQKVTSFLKDKRIKLK